MNSALALLLFAAACLVAAAAGTLFRPGEWYEALEKPSWRPPNWLFAPVWSLLYVMIAISGWLVWRQSSAAAVSLPLAVYFLQLFLNAAWTPLFFGLHRPGWAAIEIALVWLSIVATIIVFSPISALAAALLLPYLAWVTFATALNIAIWRLNLRWSERR
jgi:tryptophan-rich sensory protein